MAQKRTRKQKQKSKERVSQSLTSTTFSFDDVELGSSDSTKKVTSNKAEQRGLWMYDPRLIVGDLRKTILISLFLVALLLALYTAWASGVISL